MTDFGIDYAWGRPNPSLLRGRGVRFVCRYVSTLGNTKNISAVEARALRTAGLSIVVVFETTARRSLAGYNAGRYDAESAANQLRRAELPSSMPVYFAVDFDATPGQQEAINAYLRGAGDFLGRNKVGVYGGYYVVKRVLDAGVCRYGWQTYAWSGGQWDPRAQLQQYSNGHVIDGVNCDYDRAVASDYGQFPPPPPKPLPTAWDLPGPSPKPTWFWVWADWRRSYPRGARPDVPRLIPVWAWRALIKFNRLFPPK